MGRAYDIGCKLEDVSHPEILPQVSISMLHSSEAFLLYSLEVLFYDEKTLPHQHFSEFSFYLLALTDT